MRRRPTVTTGSRRLYSVHHILTPTTLPFSPPFSSLPHVRQWREHVGRLEAGNPAVSVRQLGRTQVPQPAALALHLRPPPHLQPLPPAKIQSERTERERERDLSRPPPAMPPWAASLVLLLLLLLLHGREGHGINLDMGEAEAQMDSEAHRMLLSAASTGNRGYISYDALRGDAVPCSRPGVPYYNCRISKTSNPYTRGCESITMCRD